MTRVHRRHASPPWSAEPGDGERSEVHARRTAEGEARHRLADDWTEQDAVAIEARGVEQARHRARPRDRLSVRRARAQARPAVHDGNVHEARRDLERDV